MIDLLTIRREIMKGAATPVSPYDAEIEYLESTGTQRLDIGITGYASVVGSAQASEIKGSTQLLLCARDDASGAVWFGEVTTKQKWGIGSDTIAYTALAPTTKVTFELDFNSTGASGKVNNISITRTSSSTARDEWTIFAPRNGSYPFSGKIYYIKFYKDNNLVRDMIPVRVGQVGYLYDKVSGTLFGNVGTGDFILGNDVTT